MIQLKNIGKSYEKSQVLWNFSYEFKEHGMYVLFGDSGCGKTTLLNIMAGMISIEEGEICAQIQGGEYLTQYQMNDAEYQEQIGYITQDAFFVDYLTMWENMKLCTDDSEKIRQICTRFGIQELLKKYPGQLSGGERQRVALVQAVLREKKILLLDEPTAALDKENKEKVFKMLWELKREKLIVCACHDKDIVPYTDEMILFENVNGKKEEKEKEGKAAFTQEVRIKEKKKKQKTEMKNGSKNQKLFRAICRQYRKTGWMEYTIMLIVFMVTILTLEYCYDFEGKLAASLKEKYHQNGVIVGIPVALHSQKFMEQLEEKYEVVESVFRYYENAPLIPPDTESTVDPNDFDSIGVLPFSKEAFPYSDHIRYGSYFTEKNQVILGWETAKELSSEPQNLIHTTYHTKLYDKEYELEIIGIFAPIDEPMDKYMKTIDEPLEDDYGVFTNGKFTKEYAFDDVTGEAENTGGKVKYAFYFADSKKLGDFEKEFAGNQNDRDKVSTEKTRYFAEYTIGTASYSDYLYPAAYTIILMSVFLYYTLKKIQLVYGQKELCVYQYYGYSYRKIKWCQIGYYLLELSTLYMTAFVLSAGVSGVVNHLNETKKFTEFLLFKMDYQRVGILYGILAVFSVVASWSIFVGLKAKGWYRLLMERRDLL